MARPTLRHHRKFRHLTRLLGANPALAWGTLELLWHVAYDQCDDLIGRAEDVEEAVCWRGKRGAGVAALVAAGFLDETDDGYRVHDLWHHAPDYVERRAKREGERSQKGHRISELRSAAGKKGAERRWQMDGKLQTARMANDGKRQTATMANVATPAPAPAPAPIEDPPIAPQGVHQQHPRRRGPGPRGVTPPIGAWRDRCWHDPQCTTPEQCRLASLRDAG